jgi:hypothetical protein
MSLVSRAGYLINRLVLLLLPGACNVLRPARQLTSRACLLLLLRATAAAAEHLGGGWPSRRNGFCEPVRAAGCLLPSVAAAGRRVGAWPQGMRLATGARWHHPPWPRGLCSALCWRYKHSFSKELTIWGLLHEFER